MGGGKKRVGPSFPFRLVFFGFLAPEPKVMAPFGARGEGALPLPQRLVGGFNSNGDLVCISNSI